MYEQILMAGFGGQGVLTCGQILALSAMAEGKYVTWMPSYGPEQRGGTAYCVVTLSDRLIGSPLPEEPNVALVFNQPSLVKFEPRLKSGGVLVVNASLVLKPVGRDDLAVYPVRADETARQAGLAKAANIVMLGAYVAASGVVSHESVEGAIREYLGSSKQHLVEVNLSALSAGRSLIQSIRARHFKVG